jgi:hypothetical protein
MTAHQYGLRQLLRFLDLAVFIIGLALVVGVGGQLLNAVYAEKTEGVVLPRTGSDVRVRFTFDGQSYEQSDTVDQETANPMPGDRVPIRAFHGYRGRVLSYLESSQQRMVRRDLWLVAAGIGAAGLAAILGQFSQRKSSPTAEPSREARRP